MSDFTRIMAKLDAGDSAAAEQLLPLVYDELRRLARIKLSNEQPGQTLQPTALVHEAYLRLMGGDQGVRDSGLGVDGRPAEQLPSVPKPEPQARSFHSRAHFFSAAAEAMRRILVENARRKARVKHGGQVERVELPDIEESTVHDAEELLALEEALNRLASEEPDKAELVKLRYFAGLTLEEAADVLGISRATASRHWTYARAWLYNALACGKH
jgi:RNA polymerase sigma factor (sigma-70 family)